MDEKKIVENLKAEMQTTDEKRNLEKQKLEMQKLCVVPDVLSSIPPKILFVEFHLKPVEMGNILTPTQVQDKPRVKWNADPNKFYLLCMTDPDAPSRDEPTLREWHHWLVGNIPGQEISKGDTLSEYIGSAPPKGTGLHRYVFILYQQNSRIEFNERILPNNSAKFRANFSIKKFAEKYNLGNPIAANFYQAEYDDYVPTVYARINCC